MTSKVDAAAMRTVHVAIGPVQDFIRQARRTRDLWAGSLLLSWLSGEAMRAVPEARERIKKPVVADDPMFLMRTDEEGRLPFIGTLPNQFTAEVPDDFDGENFKDAAQKAWRKLADAVWEEFVQPVAGKGNGTKGIWDRQVKDFWQVTWVFGDGHRLLNRRKHWRTPSLSGDEGGDHCSIMGDWQELSGYIRARERERQDAFWDAMREQIDNVVYAKKTIGSIELRRSERLCAIALIKRLFPLLPPDTLETVIGWTPDKGPDDVPNLRRRLRKYPSTAYMAAVPWLLHAWNHPQGREACKRFFAAVSTRAEGDQDWDVVDILKSAEWKTRIKGLENAGRFAALDGTFFYQDGIARRRAELRANANASENEPSNATALLSDALNTLQDAVAPQGSRRRRKLREASPFYALLLMDGDSMGQTIDWCGGDIVSRALGAFSSKVRATIADNNGMTLYAGGDDVLALLPLTTALRAAHQLSDSFREAFREQGCHGTLSGAVVFAHYSTALGTVLDTAHDRLDNAAKEANGRDSLSITLIKPGGVKAQWVSAWDLDNGQRAVDALQDLAKAFADDDERSSSFLFHIGERYGDLLVQLTTPKPEDTGDAEAISKNLVKFLVAERLKGKDIAASGNRAAYEKALQEMEELAAVCRPRSNHKDRPRVTPFNIDGAMLVKFLADNGGYPGGWDDPEKPDGEEQPA